MEIDSALRTLAKTNYYQTIYANAKDFSLRLFDDTDRISDMQIRFLNYIGFYSMIYTDIALGDIEDIIFKDMIYEDAWSYYKNN